MTDLELLDLCKSKIDLIISRMDPKSGMHEAPSESNGRYTDRIAPLNSQSWTQSFLTGMVAYMYYHYKEEKYLDFLYAMFDEYKAHIYNNLHEVCHDTGFLYSLYAVALYKITGDKKVWELALKSADELAKRHHYESGVLSSFCKLTEDKVNAIADDTMNILLIMWAHNETKHPFYERVYTKHVQAVLDYMVREDYTIRHAYAFDKKTGAPLTEKNWCGYACGSAWSRGTAWVIYGLASAIMQTQNYYQYMPSFVGVLERFINEIEKDDMVPVWDFKIPDSVPHIKDTSAAAIAASAMYTASRKMPQNEFQGQSVRCGEVSDKIFDSLVNNYLAPAKNENILKDGQTGMQNCGLVWGDYFFVELLMKRIHGDEAPNFWL